MATRAVTYIARASFRQGGGKDGKRDDAIARRIAAVANTSRTSSPPPDFASKRRKQRKQDRKGVYRFGRIVTDAGETYPCIVRDINDFGARIALQGTLTLTPRVRLIIDQTAEQHIAEVVWQRENEAGLRYEKNEEITRQDRRE
jgi:hypothetical protein